MPLRVTRSTTSSLAVCLAAVVVVASMLAAAVLPTAPALAQPDVVSIDQVNDALGIGVNLGNALEAEREGDWGLTLEADFFELIADAGFGHVRVPIKFSAYADAAPPYLIPEVDSSVRNAASLWERVDWVIEQAEANGLYVIVDLHHYDEIHEDPTTHRDRFLAIWRQIAERYADAGPLVLFELLNEPNGAFDADRGLLNDLLAAGIAEVRSTNPTRPILVGPGAYNGIGALDDLVLPDDPNLIVSVHFYDPFPFTHQGAEWTDPIPPTPTEWDAESLDFGAGWQNWSWDTILAANGETMAVDFARQWAGLQFSRPANGFDPVSLRLDATAPDRELSLRCGIVGDDGADDIDLGIVVVDAVAGVDTFDLTACPDATNRIVLMNAGPAGAMTITSAEVCLVDGRCEAILETGADRIESSFDAAARWAQANGRPINVGEFGAYSAGGAADIAERAEWTTAVRQAGTERGMSMSYWEFGAGFGVYDPIEGAWVEPLLTSLLGDIDVPVAPVPDGDVNCDGLVDIIDALAIAQYAAQTRVDAEGCPLADNAQEVHAAMGDLDRNRIVDIIDALLVAQCVAAVGQIACPAG